MAALSFGKVVNTTGNEKSKVTELSGDQIHQKVAERKEDMPETDLDELQNVMIQGMSDGGAAAVAQANPGWIVLDEEDRAHVSHLVTGLIKEKEAARQHIATPLWVGNCQALLEHVQVNVQITPRDKQSQMDVKVQLPAFDFELEDAHWTGKTAAIVRARFAQMYFIRTLLHDQIATCLKEITEQSISKIFLP